MWKVVALQGFVGYLIRFVTQNIAISILGVIWFHLFYKLSDYFVPMPKSSVGQGAFYAVFPYEASRKAFIFFRSKPQIYEIYTAKEDGVFHGAGKQESADGHPIYESIPSSDGTIPQENSDVNDDVQNQHVPSYILFYCFAFCGTAHIPSTHPHQDIPRVLYKSNILHSFLSPRQNSPDSLEKKCGKSLRCKALWDI